MIFIALLSVFIRKFLYAFLDISKNIRNKSNITRNYLLLAASYIKRVVTYNQNFSTD